MQNLLEQIEFTGRQILAKYDELEMEFNKGESASVEMMDSIQAEINELNVVQNEQYAKLNSAGYFNEKLTDVIVDQLSSQGFKVETDGEGIYTVYGDDYDVSIVKLEKGYQVETYCQLVGIEHLRVQDWTNSKVVKTLRGLNGYLRKYIGSDAIVM